MPPIVIIHYHLDPGGVTRVIEVTSKVMRESGMAHLILTGAPSPIPTSAPVRQIEGLSYRDCCENPNSGELLAMLRNAATECFGHSPVVWYFHNHSLGKNPLIPEVIRSLALANERIILHVHDLMENGRPENLKRILDRNHLYPTAPRIQYLFLNSHDRNVFVGAGLPNKQAHLIPNPVIIQTPVKSSATPRNPAVVFYPVRGIRRKNLGEILLLSVLAPSGTRFAISRAPAHTSSCVFNDFWRFQAEKHDLPVDFEVTDRLIPNGGNDASFESWRGHSTHWVTTSIAEGFGLAYFEAPANGKPVLGRRLPNLADQLPRSFDQCLYDQLLIPESWIDQEKLMTHIADCGSKLAAAWQASIDETVVNSLRDHLNRSGYFDFGNLPEDLQLEIILQCLNPSQAGEVLIEQFGRRQQATSWLATQLHKQSPPQPIETSYLTTPAIWLEQFCKIIETMDQSPAEDPSWLDPNEISKAYLTIEQFHFLQCP